MMFFLSLFDQNFTKFVHSIDLQMVGLSEKVQFGGCKQIALWFTLTAGACTSVNTPVIGRY